MPLLEAQSSVAERMDAALDLGLLGKENPVTDPVPDSEKPSSLFLAVNLLKDFRHKMQEIEDYQSVRQRLLLCVTLFSAVSFVVLISLSFWVERDNLAFNNAFYWHALPVSRVVAGGAGFAYLLHSLVLGMPLVLSPDPISYQSARCCVTCVMAIAATANFLLAMVEVPMVVNTYTGCLVNLVRWSEWVVLSFLMTFLVEIVDARAEEAFFSATLQGLSTLCGMLFPYAPNVRAFAGLLVVAMVLYGYLFVRFRQMWLKHEVVSNEDTMSALGLSSVAQERSMCALHLMRLCCLFWTIFVCTYFCEWAMNVFVESEEPAQFTFLIDTVVELFCKFFYGTYILYLQEQLLDPSAARRQRVQLIRNTMHIIWQSSHDIIVLSFPEQTHVSPGFHALIGISPGPEFELETDSSGLSKLIQIGWQEKRTEFTLEFSLIKHDRNSVNCEVKIRKLERPCVLVMIIRDISERVRLHTVEQQVMIQEVERRKDIEATRFTRHEVKNGILDAQAQLSSLKENFADFCKKGLIDTSVRTDLQHQCKQISERLAKTLETVAGNMVAKDIVNDLYVPRKEIMNVIAFIHEICSYDDLFASPSPFPKLELDPQIMTFICKNALSNAHKYGKQNGAIKIRLRYSGASLDLEIENEAGPNHDCLLRLNDPNVIFVRGWRLQENEGLSRAISSGDGAWVMKKCVDVIDGTCSYRITPTSTIFVMSCPARKAKAEPKHQSRLPPSIKVLAVDDSPIQIELIKRLFVNLGVATGNISVRGKTYEEIEEFPAFAIRSIRESPSSTFLVVIDEHLDFFCTTSKISLSRKGSEMIYPILDGIKDLSANCVILVRSANNGGDDKKKYTALGAHGTLDKEVTDKRAILDSLCKIIQERCPQAFQPRPKPQSKPRSKRKRNDTDMDMDADPANGRHKQTRASAAKAPTIEPAHNASSARANSSDKTTGLRKRKRKTKG